jgi:hypothetical protein
MGVHEKKCNYCCAHHVALAAESLNFFTQTTHVKPLQPDADYCCGVLLNQRNQPKQRTTMSRRTLLMADRRDQITK